MTFLRPALIRYKHKSLVFRSLLTVALLFMLVIGGSGYLFINYQSQTTFVTREENIDVLMNVVSDSLGLAMWNFDEKAASELLESLKKTRGFCGARLLGANGEVFVASHWGEEAQATADANLGDDTQHNFKPKHIEQADIRFIDPNKDSDMPEVIGRLEMCDNHIFLQESIDTQTQLFLFGLLALMLVLCAISWLGLKSVFAPLAKLGLAMENTRLGLKKIEDPKLLRPNEIGELGNRFNNMIDDLASAQAQLEHKIEEAHEANRAKSLFLSNMSHELRTPMHAILNYSEMGQKQLVSGDTEKLSRYLANIQAAGKRLLGLLNDLLDFSKLEAGKMPLVRTPEPIEKIIEECVAELDSLLQKKHLTFSLDKQMQPPPLLLDRKRMAQVFVNVFSNAIKYSPEGGKIQAHIFPSRLDGHPALQLTFINQGPHIPAAELESIFDVFVQSSSANHAGGTGLGLAICREIMHAHHGRIWAENLSGGVGFHLLFPITDIETKDRDS